MASLRTDCLVHPKSKPYQYFPKTLGNDTPWWNQFMNTGGPRKDVGLHFSIPVELKSGDWILKDSVIYTTCPDPFEWHGPVGEFDYDSHFENVDIVIQFSDGSIASGTM